MRTQQIGNITILIDNERYYIVTRFVAEKYNNVDYDMLPIIEKEISFAEYKTINKVYFREQKLKRILS